MRQAPTTVDSTRHPIGDSTYAARCRTRLDLDGALILEGFFGPGVIERVIEESGHRGAEAFHASSTHNVYLTPRDPDRGDHHPFNRQVASSKGMLADDQIPTDSPLRELYNDPTFRRFLRGVFGIDEIHSYADALSSVNVHSAAEAMELGWHFDPSWDRERECSWYSPSMTSPAFALDESALNTFYGRTNRGSAIRDHRQPPIRRRASLVHW